MVKLMQPFTETDIYSSEIATFYIWMWELLSYNVAISLGQKSIYLYLLKTIQTNHLSSIDLQERHFLLKTLGIESPAQNTITNPLEPPPCRKALLQGLWTTILPWSLLTVNYHIILNTTVGSYDISNFFAVLFSTAAT